MTYKEKLLEALLESDLSKIVDVVAEELDCCVNVTNPYFHMIYQTPKEEIGDYIWDSYLQNSILPPNIIKMLDENHLIEKGYHSNTPYIIKDTNLGAYPRVCAKIEKNHTIYGHMTVYFIDREVQEEDMEKMTLASHVLAQYFDSKSLPLMNVENIYELFLNNLLHGLVNGQQDLKSWQNSLPKKFEKDICVICASSTSASKVQILRTIIEELHHLYHYDVCTMYHKALYILFDKVKDASTQAFINKIIAHLKSHELKIGMSIMYQDLLKTEVYCKQAKLACDHAQIGEYSYFLEDVFSILKDDLKKMNREKVYMHPAFSLLKQYDDKNKTEYLRTLISYLHHFGRQNDVENELKVHRNTVHNRLATIEKMLDMDLNDADTFAHLLMSYYLFVVNDAQ